jgi:type IX secretion system PorP/SprF family membrane protein
MKRNYISHMKNKLLALSLVLVSGISLAQQDAQYSQYMFNPLVLNPAYAGSREAVSIVALHRSQWVGIDGAPVTNTVSINSPLKNQKLGVGLHVVTDNLGPKTTTGVLGSFAYRIKMKNGKLGFGLRAGVYSYKFNWNEITYKDPTDIYNSSSQSQKTVSTFDYGMYYYSNTFYLGGAITHLDKDTYTSSNGVNGVKSQLSRHFIATMGKAFRFSDVVTFKPSLVVKTVKNAPGSVDLNANFLFNSRFWLGGGIRSNNGLIFNFELNATKNLRIGYAYDYQMNKLKTVSKGSHEIFIGYDLAGARSKTLSPRYF